MSRYGQWEAIKKGLVSFGTSSGLFTDIDIKQFGKTDIDPFQILVKADGPLMNIVDVGYGISQILPLLYQIQNPSQHATFLLQQPEVHLHPRAQAELGSLLAQTASRQPTSAFVVETHSDYIIDRVRIEVARGNLSNDKVNILFLQRTSHGAVVRNIFLNERGEIDDPPDEFRAFFLEEHARLLGLS